MRSRSWATGGMTSDFTATLDRVERAARRALIPPPRLRLSEWIEREVILPDGVSALPGPVRLWPFQREIADAIGDPTIERVTLVKPVRVGFTTLLTSAIASFAANEPAPMLALLPTEADCRDYVVSDVEPIFAASPSLCRVLADDTDEAGRNTLLSRRFPGGSLKIVAARAPRNLRRHNVRVLLIDEADAMEVTAEGSPILLAERRTLSFPDRKIILGSTPVHEETSSVLRAYAQSDRRIFEVPCPECGAFAEITWDCIRWPEGKPEEAAWCCPKCGAMVEERHKPAMVAGGRWRALAPEVKGHAGFRMNALISLHANASWGKLAAEFVEAKGDPTRLQTFVNTILAQGWKIDAEELDENALAARAEPFGLTAIPAEVLAITAGVDVQRDRLEVAFWGWSEDGCAWCLGHTVIWGSPHDDTTWAELDSVLRTRWAHPLGGEIGIDLTAVDSGDGEVTARVYDYAWARVRTVKAVKGIGDESRAPVRASEAKIGRRKGPLFIVGTTGLKRQIFSRTARPDLMRFSADLPPEWFEQLASEREVVRYRRGQPVRVFERISGRAAEALDCTVYAFAVRHLLPTINWAERRDALAAGRHHRAGRPVRPRRDDGGWLNVGDNWL